MQRSTALVHTRQQLRTRVKGNLVSPDFTLRLMAHVGPTAAARLIGTTPGTLHKARNSSVISKPLEVAARGVWTESGYAAMADVAAQDSATPRTRELSAAVQAPLTSDGVSLLLVQVPRGREAIIQKTVEAIGGSVAVQA